MSSVAIRSANCFVQMKLLIVEPWFCGFGHPAQSLLNLASALGKDPRVEYLVSSSRDPGVFLESMAQLKAWGPFETFIAETPTGESNTTAALWALLRLRLSGRKYQRILFFDESLYILALLWPLFSILLPVQRLGVLHMFAPDSGAGRRKRWARFVIGRFLRRPEVRFYLRTEELAQSWRDAYPEVAGRVTTLPSLEIPDGPAYHHDLAPAGQVRFGVIGQIRPGKGIEWLVPAFQAEAAPGKLTVAGEFNMPHTREQLSVLQGFEGFINEFMSERAMLERAAAQDYLLMLYDVWDKRMESAVLYLAARVNRPVIVYGDSWSGRMVREFGCGLCAPTDHAETIELLRDVPRPGSAEYDGLLKGMEAFREVHSVGALRGRVIQELLG